MKRSLLRTTSFGLVVAIGFLSLSHLALAQDRFFINNQTVIVGQTGVEIELRVDTPDDDRHAMSFAFTYDNTKLELVSPYFNLSDTEFETSGWSMGTVCHTLNAPSCPVGGAVTWSIVKGLNSQLDDFAPENIFSAGTNKVAAKLIFNVITTEPGTALIEFTDTVEIFEFASLNRMVTSGFSEGVDLTSATITIMRVVPPGSFIRGDIDGNIDFANPRLQLADAINGLSFQFLGTFQPTCLDAVDVDDNGETQLADYINLLGTLFLGNFVIPAPNIMTGCGEDTTPDKDGGDLGCLSYPPCEP